ncbi:hypothetical protein AB6A40_000403 [Gnathostoma spinigerum]|uniref:CxC3 like cysteine cluster domain-containing protein n=1 Tax=Gnathostoma spinigerum TaxID=75299 RepID=A0ABD6E213_9BILA
MDHSPSQSRDVKFSADSNEADEREVSRQTEALRTYIVRVESLMDTDELLKEFVNLFELSGELEPSSNAGKTVEWLAARRVICNTQKCSLCNGQCVLIMDDTDIDNLKWYCRACNRKQSIREGSFFMLGNDHSLFQLVSIIYCFIKQLPHWAIAVEAELESREEAQAWCERLRSICVKWFSNHQHKLGEQSNELTPKIVEMGCSRCFEKATDTSLTPKVHSPKNRVSQGPSERLLFAVVEQDSRKCHMINVTYWRNPKWTLGYLLHNKLIPGTKVVCDECCASKRCSGINPCSFVHPDGLASLRKCWLRFKRFCSIYPYNSSSGMNDYLKEFMWRNAFSHGNLFAQFLLCLREQYPATSEM